MSTLPTYGEALSRPTAGSQQYHCPCCTFYPHNLTPYSSYVTGHKFCGGVDSQTVSEDRTLPDKLRAIRAARRYHLRSANLSKRAEQLANILHWILAKDYGLLDTLPVLPFTGFFRAGARAWRIARALRYQRESERWKRNPYFREVLKERFYEPCDELGLPTETVERIMSQVLDPKFGMRDQSRLKQVVKEEGLDALALSLCYDAVQIIPVVARTEEGAQKLLEKVGKLSKRDFPDGHCWLEFLPQVVGSTS